MLGWAREQRLPAVVTNAVRYAHPDQAGIAEVLDASRLLVPLSSPRLERQQGAHAYVKSGQEMAEIAAEIAHASGDKTNAAGNAY